LEIARTADDPNLIGRMELQLGAALHETTTDTDYVRHVHEARRLLEARPEPTWWEPVWEDALNNRLLYDLLPLDDPRSAEHLQAAVRGFTEAADEAMTAYVVGDSSRESETLEHDLKAAAVTLRRLGDDVGHGSVQMELGLLLIRNGRLHEAVELLREHLGPLRDAINISFWAFASAMLAGAEAEIGSAKQAAKRLTELIGLLPTLPRSEWILARVFDASAATLASAERPEDAAVVLGKARAVPFTLNTIYPREIVQTPILDRLNETLREDTLTTLLAEGAAMTDASGLEVTEAWLEECAYASNESERLTPTGQ
jgi:hypothetical protein